MKRLIVHAAVLAVGLAGAPEIQRHHDLYSMEKGDESLDSLPIEYRASVSLALKKLAEPDKGKYIRTIQKAKNKEYIGFLLANMPEDDLKSGKMTERFLADIDKYTKLASQKVGWRLGISDELVLDCIIPYKGTDEPIPKPYRKRFFREFFPLVRNCESSGEAAVLINNKLAALLASKKDKYKFQEQDLDIFEVIENGGGREEDKANLAIAALRSLYIPARQAFVLSWDDSGTGSWIEIWDTTNGNWHSLMGCKSGGLDMTDFENEGKTLRAPKIYAASFRQTNERGLKEAFGRGAIDITDRYAPTGTLVAKTGLPNALVYATFINADGERNIVDAQFTEKDGTAIFDKMNSNCKFSLYIQKKSGPVTPEKGKVKEVEVK